MKKLSVLFLMTCFLLILLPTATFYAVPASPVPFPALQPDGSTIMVLLRGDEFLNWAEDMDGNLIIYDIDQNGYCYANWTGELPESTGELIIDTQTKTFGVHTSQRRENSVNIPETTIKAANEQRERLRHVTSQVSSRSRISYNFESQLLDQPAVADISELRRKVLVIIVRWEDESNLYGLEPLTGQQIHDLMFNPLTNSVNAYFMELLGKTEDIVIPAQALNPFDGNQGILEVFIPGSHTDPRLDFGKMDRIVNAAYDAVGPYINFADYDVNGDGYVSSDELTVCVIVHGYEAAYGAPGPSVWGSAGYTGGMRDGVWTPSTFIQGAYHYDHPLTIGILCHEFGHSGYHFDDTYDYGYLYDGVSSQGMGHWSLMAGGGWASKNGEYLGETPSYVDAYNLVEYCLISPGIISGREENIKSVSQTDIFIVISPYNDRQYFLTQLRKYGETNNYDRGIFEQMGVYSDTSVGGLLIYHIDEDVWSMNNKNTHYRAGIEEAHGVQQHLSILWGTSGSLNDLWGTDYILFSQTTDPSSGLYSPFTWDKTPPTQDQESGVTIHGITWDSAAQSTTFGVRESMFYSEAFPDPNFRAIALSLIGGGRNDSSLFTGDDRAFFAAIAQLDTANKNIADLTGIEHFSGLNQLYCQGNRLIKLDLTKNNMLSAVNCSGNWLRSVLLPENPLLSLDCSDNFLVSPNSIFRYKNVLDFTFGIQKDPALMTYAVAFPDRIFRSIAVGLIGDARGDDEIVRAGDKDFWASYGSHEYGYLYLTNRGISEMAGIEFFTGLKQLDCGTSSLKVLDISKNTALTIVTCYNNMLEALDVSQNTDLVTLWCFNNQISILDVSLNTALVQLDCMNNYFTKLDISQNVFLVELDCRGNQLTELDITNNTALTFLNCGGNQLTELDVSNNHALKNLYCWGNQLTELDTSKNSDLEVLSCFDNQLTVLETSKNSQLIVLFCYNNQLTGLNVLQNTSLELLFCHNNHMLSPDDVIGWRGIGLILGETFSY